MNRGMVLLLAVALTLSGCIQGLPFLGPSPKDFLTNSPYDTWVIEIDYDQGHRPSQQAIDLLRTTLKDITKKTTIDIRVDDELNLPDQTWTTSKLDAARRQHQDAQTGGNTIVTHVLYVGGNSDADTSNGKVLGVAFGHRNIVMFDETIDNSANIFFSSTSIERSVLVHEFGHIIGLVDNGLEMVKPHSDGNGHSKSRESVMYYALETTDFLQVFTGGLPTTFDSDDKADICNGGGKCA